MTMVTEDNDIHLIQSIHQTPHLGIIGLSSFTPTEVIYTVDIDHV